MSSSKLVMEAFKKLPSFNNRREISKELNCKSELKMFSFTTSHCCGTLLQDFKYPQSKKTYFMSSSAISSMKLPLRNCSKCTTLFYPDFQDMGLLHFHNKVPTSYYVMMNFLICFPIWSNIIHRLKYQRSMTLGCKDIRIKKAKIQLLCFIKQFLIC